MSNSAALGSALILLNKTINPSHIVLIWLMSKQKPYVSLFDICKDNTLSPLIQRQKK